jgi:hypothetical protein
MAESIKYIEPVGHVDNAAELSEAVVTGNTNVVSPEPHGEAAEYHRGDMIPTSTEEVVVPENLNANVVLPEPDLRHREEPEAHHDDDAVPVVTERERQNEEPQQKSEPIIVPVPVPVPIPSYDTPSYPMNLGSKQEVWGGEHDHHDYPLHSVPVINHPSPEDVKGVETSPAPGRALGSFIILLFEIRS